MGAKSDTPSFEGDWPAAADATAIGDRKELALVAVERTRMPMVVTDPRQADNPIVLANAAFLELTGYRAHEVLGRNCRFLQGPKTDPIDVDTIRQGIAAGRDQVSVELLNYRKDGSTFSNELVLNRITDDCGQLLYYFASQKDVTERRTIERLEAMERQLLMEVDHRALNALTLVQSIVRLSRADTTGGYAASVLGRVDALARAHRLLAASGWTGVDFGQLLAGEVPDREKARVQLSGEPAHIQASLVQPLALALHELVTNAREHGALLQEGGRVNVSWMSQCGRLLLDWEESGGPAPDLRPEPGFGLRTVSGVIERQLRGEMKTSWDRQGFRARLSVPSPVPGHP